jgi:uncharacterized protein (TIGR02246 family)
MTSDEQSIHEILKQLEAAWNASDSRRWTSFFANNANFIHIFGGQLDGHAAIEGSHRVIFDTIYKGSRLSIESRSIRFVRPEVAVVFARMHLELAQGAPMPDFDTRPTMVMAKEQGKWQIVFLQNTRISEIPAAAQAAAGLAT